MHVGAKLRSLGVRVILLLAVDLVADLVVGLAADLAADLATDLAVGLVRPPPEAPPHPSEPRVVGLVAVLGLQIVVVKVSTRIWTMQDSPRVVT
jgi:hypothetical protein